MNYDNMIRDITEAIKKNKSIKEPWRKYALEALDKVQALVDEGQKATPEDMINNLDDDNTDMEDIPF